MTFRTGKKHKAQESTKAAKNALKLASRFQHFLTTGVASKKDLKEVDERFVSQVSQQSDRILTLLDQLRDIAPKGRERELIDHVCEDWAKWVSTIYSKENLGYSSLKLTDYSTDETIAVLLEGVVDSETHLFQMLFALKSSLSLSVKSSDRLDAKISEEYVEGTREIMECFQSRQRTLSKIASSAKK